MIMSTRGKFGLFISYDINHILHNQLNLQYTFEVNVKHLFI